MTHSFKEWILNEASADEWYKYFKNNNINIDDSNFNEYFDESGKPLSDLDDKLENKNYPKNGDKPKGIGKTKKEDFIKKFNIKKDGDSENFKKGNENIETNTDNTSEADSSKIEAFLNNTEYKPEINISKYSAKQIEKNTFKGFGALEILYSAVKKFNINKNWVTLGDSNTQIGYLLKKLSEAAGGDGNKELSQEEYIKFITNASKEGYKLANQPGILNFALFLIRLKTIGVLLPANGVYYIQPSDFKMFFEKGSEFDENIANENKNIAYEFFKYYNAKLTPRNNEFGSTLRNLKSLLENITFKLDNEMMSRTKTVDAIANFVKTQKPKEDEEKKDNTSLGDKVKNEYLSKKYNDTVKNVERYNKVTDELKYKGDVGEADRANDEEQSKKTDSGSTYGFNVSIPNNLDTGNTEEFFKRVEFLIRKDLADIVGVLNAKGIAGENSKANKLNNAISKSWNEAISVAMKKNNSLLTEGFLDRINPLRGAKDNKLANNGEEKDGDEYRSSAEQRAKKIYDEYYEKAKDIIENTKSKVQKQKVKVDNGKTRKAREWAEYKGWEAMHKMLEALYNLKIDAKIQAKEGGLVKVAGAIKNKVKETIKGDSEYQTKNTISDANNKGSNIVKFATEQPDNDMKVIAQLAIVNAIFNSETAEEAVEKLNNGKFDFIGLNDIGDTSVASTDTGVRVNLISLPKIYKNVGELLRATKFDFKDLNADSITKAKKLLEKNKENLLANISKFKEIIERVKTSIRPTASISLEGLFNKCGFILNEESQEVINTRNELKNSLELGKDLTDIIGNTNLNQSSLDAVALKQAMKGYVLLTGTDNGKQKRILLNPKQFREVQQKQSDYKSAIQKDASNQQSNQQNVQQQINQTNSQQPNNQPSNQTKGTEANSEQQHSSVTTDCVDSTYGNGYNKNPLNRMREIIYKKGNYTIKTKQMS